MIPIYPLTEENILKHRGKMVLACTHDGRTYVGKLTHCRDGHIILDGDDSAVLNANMKTSKKRPHASKIKKVAPKAQVRAFYPYGYYYPPYGYGFGAGLALSLGLLALLFLI
ncbi:hypothetical protein [Paenibacillus azoreducens]|uniref:Uncharacterized protein n=2 Tax=Paenibacillus TaxID=44249 RepID=A0A919Y990_9BACL|nr:hypothetical protein [Paenibacillus azoreducens]GIO47346.1 hypothetical protein J34TS1_21110 [Paenibacillus azoreducens]